MAFRALSFPSLAHFSGSKSDPPWPRRAVCRARGGGLGTYLASRCLTVRGTQQVNWVSVIGGWICGACSPGLFPGLRESLTSSLRSEGVVNPWLG